jgi:hypothetical protein
MQSRSFETFGDAIGAAYTTLKRSEKRVRKRVDRAGERIVRRAML